MSRKTRPLTQVDSNNQPIQDSELWVTFRGEYNLTNLIYAGGARPGSKTSAPVWQIKRMTYDGSNNTLAVEHPTNASGVVSADYEFVWDDRAAYTYA